MWCPAGCYYYLGSAHVLTADTIYVHARLTRMPVLHRHIVRAPQTAVTNKQIDTSAYVELSEVISAPTDTPTCRLCWDTEEEQGNELISPCACSGSLKYIHRRCLLDWQRTLRSQGQGRRANTCELVGPRLMLLHACMPSSRRAYLPLVPSH